MKNTLRVNQNIKRILKNQKVSFAFDKISKFKTSKNLRFSINNWEYKCE